jgi:hypothetical protein
MQLLVVLHYLPAEFPTSLPHRVVLLFAPHVVPSSEAPILHLAGVSFRGEQYNILCSMAELAVKSLLAGDRSSFVRGGRVEKTSLYSSLTEPCGISECI